MNLLYDIKVDFPIFKHNPRLVYLDSTATSLKPKPVIEKLREYYEQYSANVFRGIYKISEKATKEYEESREVVAKFINAKSSQEIVFTRSTTESLNLIAYSLGRKIIGEGDEVVTSIMEHHSNFVPWQVLAGEVGATFKVIDITNDGYLNLGLDNIKYQISTLNQNKFGSGLPRTDLRSGTGAKILNKIITKKTKILTLTYVSNVLGTINPIKEIVIAAKQINPNIVIIVDAAQAIPHMKIDVQDLGCDFLAFSSHKMLGPTGVGVLWGRLEFLKEMYPFNYGGEMIREVYVDKTVFKDPPHKFEAGTPAIAEVIALKESIKYLQSMGFQPIQEHEQKLMLYCFKSLKQIFGEKIKIFGPAFGKLRAGIISFSFKNYHPHDIAQILDEQDIAIRAGHHCAMPLHQRLGVVATARVSFYIYNTKEDVDRLMEGLKRVERILQ